MKYRKDVEGLRALAVMPIVLFHAGFESLTGGFVGVDVFFVISGFLITSIISREISEGSFSLLRFYGRRMVRIFPALFAMLIIIGIIGEFYLFPSSIRTLAESSATTAIFASNIFFWLNSDYFAAAADLQIMLHTWSLGVEEQFYLFYPFFLLLVARFARRWLWQALALLTAASFLLSWSLVVTGHDRSAFFLLPGRVWELGIGGLVAVGAYPRLSSPWLRNVLGLCGFGAVLAGYFVIRAQDDFPAPWALLPCVGSSLIIAYGPDTYASRLLSLSPCVWIGRISYSLYLWHWPIMAIYRIGHGIILSPGEGVFLVLLSIAAATASYSLLEQPVLRQLRGANPKRIVPVGLTAAAGILALGLAASATAYVGRHYPPNVERIIAYSDYTGSPEYRYQFRTGTCFMEDTKKLAPWEQACLELSDNKPNLIIAGDSFAAQYWRALSLRFPDYNVVQATAPSCRPTVNPVGWPSCVSIIKAVLGKLTDTGKVDAVVMVGRWMEMDLPKLQPTIGLFRSKGIPVLVVGPSVEYEGEYPDLAARALTQNNLAVLDASRDTRRKQMSDRMRRLVIAAGGNFFSPYDMECSKNRCLLTLKNGAPPHFDCCHLTFPMSVAVVNEFPVVWRRPQLGRTH